MNSRSPSRLLEVDSVSKSFGGLKALDRVSFEVEEGAILGLIGPNGAGKTTLFDVVAGLQRPDEGSILFRGIEITGWPAHRVARLGIAKTFQLVALFTDMTVLDNVVVGALLRCRTVRDAKEKAMRWLDWVGLGDRAGELTANLTLADRTRVELARALATEPLLLLMDEVMAGLNSAEVDEVVELVRRIRDRGATVILVEHNMRAIMSVCERIVVLDYGVKIAEGSPQAVRSDPKVIESYLGELEANA